MQNFLTNEFLSRTSNFSSNFNHLKLVRKKFLHQDVCCFLGPSIDVPNGTKTSKNAPCTKWRILDSPDHKVIPRTIPFSSKVHQDFTNLEFWNSCFDKSRLKAFVSWFLKTYGEKKTIQLLEQFKLLGFGYATQAGISLGIDDLSIPPQKMGLLYASNRVVVQNNSNYKNAKITAVEKIQVFIDIWNETSENLKKEVIQYFEKTNIFNPVYMMAFSGARGNISQVRQLVGMRGLMSDPQGNIIDFPIQSNFKEGLTLTEYIISTYGARKGIVDTALRTATAGYLTRRLVDVAQHVIISLFDCKTNRGIYVFDMKEGTQTLYSFQNRLIGRVLASNIKQNSKDIAFRNQEICSNLALSISEVRKKAFVRSVLTCKSSKFVCQLCYGWSLSSNKLVSLGEAVGVIAAQSIGEPGTQLTMRTFHTGGVFSGGLTETILANFDGSIEYLEPIPGTCIRTLQGKIAFLTKMESSFVLKRRNEVAFHKIPGYAILFYRHNQLVKKKQVIAQFSMNRIYNRKSAEQIVLADLEGQIFFNEMDLLEKRSNQFIEDTLWKSAYKSKIWILSGKVFPVLDKFLVQNKDFVNKNVVIQRLSWYHSDNSSFLFNQKKFSNNFSLKNPNDLISKSKKGSGRFLGGSFLGGFWGPQKTPKKRIGPMFLAGFCSKNSPSLGSKQSYIQSQPPKKRWLKFLLKFQAIQNFSGKNLQLKIPSIYQYNIYFRSSFQKNSSSNDFSKFFQPKSRLALFYSSKLQNQGDVFPSRFGVFWGPKKNQIIQNLDGKTPQKDQNLKDSKFQRFLFTKKNLELFMTLKTKQDFFPNFFQKKNLTIEKRFHFKLDQRQNQIPRFKSKILYGFNLKFNPDLFLGSLNSKISKKIQKTFYKIETTGSEVEKYSEIKHRKNHSKLHSIDRMIPTKQMNRLPKQISKNFLLKPNNIQNYFWGTSILGFPLNKITFKETSYIFEFKKNNLTSQKILSFIPLKNLTPKIYENLETMSPKPASIFHYFPSDSLEAGLFFESQKSGSKKFQNFFWIQKNRSKSLSLWPEDIDTLLKEGTKFSKTNFNQVFLPFHNELKKDFKMKLFSKKKEFQLLCSYKRNPFEKFSVSINHFHWIAEKTSRFYSLDSRDPKQSIYKVNRQGKKKQICFKLSGFQKFSKKSMDYFHFKNVQSRNPLLKNYFKLQDLKSLKLDQSSFSSQKSRDLPFSGLNSNFKFYQNLGFNVETKLSLYLKNSGKILSKPSNFPLYFKANLAKLKLFFMPPIRSNFYFKRKVKEYLFDSKDFCSILKKRTKLIVEKKEVLAQKLSSYFFTFFPLFWKGFDQGVLGKVFLDFLGPPKKPKKIAYDQTHQKPKNFQNQLGRADSKHEKKFSFHQFIQTFQPGWIYKIEKFQGSFFHLNQVFFEFGKCLIHDLYFEQNSVFIQIIKYEKFQAIKWPIMKKNLKCRYFVSIPKKDPKIALLIRPVSSKFLPHPKKSKKGLSKLHQPLLNTEFSYEVLKDYHSDFLNKQSLTLNRDFLSNTFSDDFHSLGWDPLSNLKELQKKSVLSKKRSKLRNILMKNFCNSVAWSNIRNGASDSFPQEFYLPQVPNWNSINELKKSWLISQNEGKGKFFQSNKNLYYSYKTIFSDSFQLLNVFNKKLHFLTDLIQSNIRLSKKSPWILSSLPYFQWFLIKPASNFFNFGSETSKTSKLAYANRKLLGGSSSSNSKSSFLFYKFRLVLKNQVFANTDYLSPFTGELIESAPNSWWKDINDLFLIRKKQKMNQKIFLGKKDIVSVLFPKSDFFSNKFHNKVKEFPMKFKKKYSQKQPKILVLELGEKGKIGSKKLKFQIDPNFGDSKASSMLMSSFVSAVLNVSLKKSYRSKNLSTNKKFAKKQEKFSSKFFNKINLNIFPQNSFYFSPVSPETILNRFQIENFFTKYQKKFYKLKGLAIGKPNKFVQICLGKFLFKGDLLNALTSFQHTGQIIHFNSEKITLRHAQSFLVSAKGILHVHQGDSVLKNAPVLTLPFDTFTTGDIVQGIPKVEQYLEARTTQNQRPFLYSLPILLQGIFQKYCTKFPLEQAVSQSFLKIQLIIVDGVQRVYRSQGVSIADKHLEVIVKQMTSKVQIIHGGQTGFFPGELVDLEIVERINSFLMIQIQYEPIVLGITRASLEVESFLSAASFQQTTKILAKASLYKKKDFLKGLKENILIGNLIPAGSGSMNFI